MNEATRGRLASLRASCERLEVNEGLRDGTSPRALLRQLRAASREVERSAADVVQIRGRALGPACWAVHRRGGPGSVQTLPLGVPPLGGARGTIRRATGRTLGDRVIATSTLLAGQAVGRLGVPRPRVRLVPHGIPLPPPPAGEDRARARQASGISPSTFVCCSVARLDPVKRHDVTIAAVARLVAEGRDVVLHLAGSGDGTTTRHVRRLAVDHGVADRVRLLGYVDASLPLAYADAKVLASDLEGFATAVVEAMACGVVPVRTPTEGASDQITDGVDGLLFPIGDDAALADRLRFLMDNPDERRRMGKAAAETARAKFSAEVMAEKTIAVYRELTDGLPPDPRTLPDWDTIQ